MTAIQIPWAAWHGDYQIELTFPASWNVTEARMQDAPALSDQEIGDRLKASIDSAPLRSLAQHRQNAVIVVEDITRPTPLHRLLPPLLAELEAGGIPAERVRILIGSASHRPNTRADAVKKLGREIVETVEVRNHHPYENLVSLGVSERGTPILMNRDFVEADLKIAIGTVVPHEDAGFGGGAKVVGIGLAGVETLAVIHGRTVAEGPVGLGRLEGNFCRADFEDIALRAGLEMTINVVINSQRDIAGVFAGHPIAAHRAAVALARQVYTTELPRGVDIGIFNAYPKDTELMLGFNALNPGYRIGEQLIQPDGTVVVTMAASEGYGFHSINTRQGFAYSPELAWGRRLIVYSPNLTQADIQRFCPDGTLLFKEWPSLVEMLQAQYSGRTRAVVLPYGTIQLGGGEHTI
jgi:nickel-dependent lactate racemase